LKYFICNSQAYWELCGSITTSDMITQIHKAFEKLTSWYILFRAQNFVLLINSACGQVIYYVTFGRLFNWCIRLYFFVLVWIHNLDTKWIFQMLLCCIFKQEWYPTVRLYMTLGGLLLLLFCWWITSFYHEHTYTLLIKE